MIYSIHVIRVHSSPSVVDDKVRGIASDQLAEPQRVRAALPGGFGVTPASQGLSSASSVGVGV